MSFEDNIKAAFREHNKLIEENTELTRRVTEQQMVLDLCPGCLPGGAGMLSPKRWIIWARKKLGYPEL